MELKDLYIEILLNEQNIHFSHSLFCLTPSINIRIAVYRKDQTSCK